MIRIRLRIVLLAAFALAGCDSSTGPQSHVRATIAIDRTIVPRDSSVDITIYVVNDGADTVTTANPNSYACLGAFVATDSTGRAVGPTPRLCSLVGYLDVKLAPHDSVVVRDRWSPVTVVGGDAVMVLPNGRYGLTAQVTAEQRAVRSSTVQVQVVNP